MRIERIIGSAFWVTLLACLGILIASVDHVPDLPALRQATVAVQASNTGSRCVPSSELDLLDLGARSEMTARGDERADERPFIAAAVDRSRAQSESDTSPPIPVDL